MALAPGTRLGAYEIVGLLGAGGMGEVYRAADIRLGRYVAIKILPEAFQSDPERVARFQREARTLASLNHPNIGGIHGLEETEDGAALVLELVEGPTLADRIAQGPLPIQQALSITPDGTQLVVREDRPKTGLDLAMLTFDSKPQVTPLIRTPYSERNAEISPNGHWLAYESDESGREEIWVRPFPDVNAGRWQVSTGGGRQPLWARNGRELFFRGSDGSVIAVQVENVDRAARGAGFSWGPPSVVLQGRTYFFYNAGLLGRSYDVSSDGQRFLMIEAGSGVDAASERPSIVVVQNWTEELKRLAPRN
jgi:serine/threonine-protein kinase